MQPTYRNQKLLLRHVADILDSFEVLATECGAANRVDLAIRLEIAYDAVELIEKDLIADVIKEET